MVMPTIDRDTAVEFVKRINAATDYLMKTMDALKATISESDHRTVVAAILRADSDLDLGVLEIIYRCHPDLRPEGHTRVVTLREMDNGARPRKRPDSSTSDPAR
jgi:hypothetical protein